jgi:hypothetical protein
VGWRSRGRKEIVGLGGHVRPAVAWPSGFLKILHRALGPPPSLGSRSSGAASAGRRPAPRVVEQPRMRVPPATIYPCPGSHTDQASSRS